LRGGQLTPLRWYQRPEFRGPDRTAPPLVPVVVPQGDRQTPPQQPFTSHRRPVGQSAEVVQVRASLQKSSSQQKQLPSASSVHPQNSIGPLSPHMGTSGQVASHTGPQATGSVVVVVVLVVVVVSVPGSGVPGGTVVDVLLTTGAAHTIPAAATPFKMTSRRVTGSSDGSTCPPCSTTSAQLGFVFRRARCPSLCST
jgi:hypothetical protein